MLCVSGVMVFGHAYFTNETVVAVAIEFLFTSEKVVGLQCVSDGKRHAYELLQAI